MPLSTLLLTLLLLSIFSFWLGRRRASAVAGGKVHLLHSRPNYYGYLTAIWCGVPAFILVGLWVAFESSLVTHLVVSALPTEIQNQSPDMLKLVVNDVRNLAMGNISSGGDKPEIMAAAEHYKQLMSISNAALVVVVLSIAIIGMLAARHYINPEQRARNKVEWVVRVFLILCAVIAIVTTIGIVLSVLFEAIRFFEMVPITHFLFGLEWSPQISIRADQVGSSGSFGMIPLFAGTMLIAFIAMMLAVPLGLLSAIYLSEYAGERFRSIAKPLLEILAGIPTVVYGFFAAIVMAPMIRDAGASIGLDVASESALAAGLVMGIMIIPFISSLSDDVIHAVPQAMRDGSYGLGATKSETIMRVVIPAALPGIVAGILLAVSRAIGETMIVVMAAGLAANLTANPLEAVTTVTVQIVTLLVGDQEFDSPKTLAAFALGLVLFVVTLVLNMIALHVVSKYREQYE